MDLPAFWLQSWQLVVDLVAALAWPVAVIAIAKMFRSEFQALFNRVVTLKTPIGDLGFAGQEAKEAVATALADPKNDDVSEPAELSEPEPARLVQNGLEVQADNKEVSPQNSSDEDLAKKRRSARIMNSEPSDLLRLYRKMDAQLLSPQVVVEERWIRLEKLLREIYQREDALPPMPVNFSELISTLTSRNVISDSVAVAVEKLLWLRRKISAGAPNSFKANDLWSYLKMFDEMEKLLKLQLSRITDRKR